MPTISSIIQGTLTPATLAPGVLQAGVGELATLDQNPYQIDTYQYPSTLGSNDAPHYMTFNINLPVSSQYIANGAVTTVPTVNSAAQQNYDVLSNQTAVYQPPSGLAVGGVAGAAGACTTVTQLLSGTGIGSSFTQGISTGAASGVAGITTQGITLQPQLSRIATSISLYIPDTIAVMYDHDWASVSLTQALGNFGMWQARGSNLRGQMQSIDRLISAALHNNFIGGRPLMYNDARTAEFAGQIGQATGQLGPNFTDITLKSAGKALNPQFEMIFRGTKQRQYQFIYHFQARSQAEATQIYQIIKVFRTYAAPEIANVGNGRYFIPPAQFDVKFYFQNAENQAIAKMSTCALTNISVNYAGAGQFATFLDGNPIDIELQLSFIETDIIYRELIDKFGY